MTCGRRRKWKSGSTAQNKVTFGYLEAIAQREPLRERLTELWDYEKYSSPSKTGGRYFYFHNTGLQNQSVLFTMTSLKSEPRVLIDPNKWSADGTVALSGLAPSDDGKYIAYGIQDAGSDWLSWKIMEIDSGKILDDELKWIKFSGMSWTKDGAGLFYSRYDEPKQDEKFQSLNLNQKIFYHRVGTPQSEDVLVYCRPDHPDWGFQTTVTEDGRYLVITVWKGTDDKYRVVVQGSCANRTACRSNWWTISTTNTPSSAMTRRLSISRRISRRPRSGCLRSTSSTLSVTLGGRSFRKRTMCSLPSTLLATCSLPSI